MHCHTNAIATLPNSQKQDMHQTSTKNQQSTTGQQSTISKKLMVQYATRAAYEKGTEKKRTEDEIKRDCKWQRSSKASTHQRIVGEERRTTITVKTSTKTPTTKCRGRSEDLECTSWNCKVTAANAKITRIAKNVIYIIQ
tara:strand:+ start:159 stop:578 length:420 start_codon:yes stop_codon:yes gene_type:complete